VLVVLIALFCPLMARAQKEVRFPGVTGENLEKRRFHLPEDLPGDLNIVLLGFQREQQGAIDTWIPAVRELCATSPALRYYEVPVLQKMTPQAAEFINQGMSRGIADKGDRERTITLYIDKAPFEKSLGIVSDAAIQVILMDRQGRIVWQGEGAYTPEKAKALASTAQEWLGHNGARIETLAGKTAALNDYRGKVVLLLISGKGPAGAAARLLQEVYLGSGARGDIVYVTDADLTAAPGVLRGMIRGDVKETAKKNHARLLEAMQQAGIAFDPQREPITLLDWQGVLTRQFDVSGKTDRVYQAFVLNREGRTVFHYEQSKADENASSPAPQVIKALQEAVK
jgi:transposase InsO family protein